ncbi:hypothetical protein HDV00_004503 [Rhizophlyctis rosea]|nr:hypothetical protein HDV00_004503 [Rhizophlyctis rosea]
MVGPFEDEVEIAPGIYLTKYVPKPSTSTTSPQPPPTQPTSLASTLLSSSPAETAAHIQEEITRLRRSVELLLRSNQEMKEADPSSQDPIFVEAITENTAVISRQLYQIRKYEEELQKLGLGAGAGGSGRGCGTQAGTGRSSSSSLSSPSSQSQLTSPPSSSVASPASVEAQDGLGEAEEDGAEGGVYL